LLESGSFDTRKDAAAPMIAMLDRSELDIEVSDAGIETAESNNCRGVFKKNRDANGMLAITQEGARFSCKDGQKFINPFTQSISGLCWASVVATTRPISNSSTSGKSQREISSRNTSCAFTRELNREPQQYSTDYLYKVLIVCGTTSLCLS